MQAETRKSGEKVAVVGEMYIFPDIVQEFACVQCGACCSRDWLVTVDESRYRRNEKLFAGCGWMDEFHQAFVPLPGGFDLGEYAQIAKKTTGGCWFLTPDKLCRLQQMAGHEHLDTVCQWFPRYPMDTARGIELSLSFSCPAALRLAMREKPLRFIRQEELPLAEKPADFIVHVYPEQQPRYSPLRYYFEVEGHLIDVLQERRLPLPDRLAMVRDTLRGLSEAEPDEAPAERLDRLTRENYARIDSQEAGKSAIGSPPEWLVENFLVNFIFRKNIYVNGLLEAEKTLGKFAGRLEPYLGGRPAAAADSVGLPELIVGLELELNHQNRRPRGALG